MLQCKAVCYKYTGSILFKSGDKTETLLQCLVFCYSCQLLREKEYFMLCFLLLRYNKICSFSYIFCITLNS